MLSDKKLKDASCKLLTALAEATSPAFVAARVAALVTDGSLKGAPAIVGSLEWTATAADEFGARSIPSKPVIAMAHTAVAHKDAKVRLAGVGVLGSFYAQLGPKFKAQALPEALAAPAVRQITEVGLEGYWGQGWGWV